MTLTETVAKARELETELGASNKARLDRDDDIDALVASAAEYLPADAAARLRVARHRAPDLDIVRYTLRLLTAGAPS